MLRNYLKTTWRNLLRNKAYSLINILGLAIALSCFSLFYLYVEEEQQFDRFHTNSDRIYRVGISAMDPQDGLQEIGSVPMSLGETLVEEFPEVEKQVAMFRFGQSVVRYEDKRFNDRDWLIVKGDFFDIFDFNLLEGDRATVLDDPHSVVLTETYAQKLFGEEDPIGKTIWINRFEDLKVTGLMEDPPVASHIQFSMLIPHGALIPAWKGHLKRWDVWAAFMYVRLSEEGDVDQLGAAMPKLVEQHMSAEEEVQNFFFQPMEDVHLHSQGGISHCHLATSGVAGLETCGRN